ncbi:MAG: hypothetical protein LQ351_003178 [Letrouitia transgressa]|nr:MAG: hypothetical protein LQ351_003178 [Letrouitia transgressa]
MVATASVPPRSYLPLDSSNAIHQFVANEPVADRYHAFGSNVQAANLNRLASVGLQNSFGNSNVQADDFTASNNIFPARPSNAAQGVVPPSRIAQRELDQSTSSPGYRTAHQRSLDGSLAVSDLEDGELNEGPDTLLREPYSGGPSSSVRHQDSTFNKSQPQSRFQINANPSSRPLLANQAPESEGYPGYTTSMDGALRVSALGVDSGLPKVASSNAHLNDDYITKDSLVTDHETRKYNTTSSASLSPDMELEKARSDAKTALEQLLLHNIGYFEVVGEGVDPRVLSSLYEEIYEREQAPSAEQTSTANTRHQQRPDRILVPSSSPRLAKFSPSALPNLTEHTSSLLVERGNTTLPTVKSNRNEAGSRTASRPAGQEKPGNRTSSPMQQDNNDCRYPESKFPMNTTNSSGLSYTSAPTGGTENQGELTAKAKSANFTGNSIPSPSNHLSHVAPPVTTLANQKKATATAFSTPSSLGKDNKPLSRKDLIAQKLAERSGRSLPTSNGKAVRPIVEPSTVQSASEDRRGDQGQLAAARATPEKEILSLALPTGSVNARPTKIADKAILSQDLDRSTDESLAAKESHQLSKNLRQPHTSQQVTSSSSSHHPPIARMPGKTESRERSQVLSPSTILPFSSHSAPFSIPGLFMTSTSQTEEQLQANKTKNLTRPIPQNSLDNILTPQFEDRSNQPAINATTSGNLQSGIPSLPVEIPSAAKAIVPHKRPRASDFVELPVSNAKKIRPYRDDTQVVIEVSEDEDDDETESDSAPDMAKYSNPIAIRGHPPKPVVYSQTNNSLSTRNATTQVIPPRMKGTPKLSANLNPAQQSPVAGKEQPELKTKEEEIKNMRGKIAEMERRMRAKQGVSRAQSPATPGTSTVMSNPSGTIKQPSTAEPKDDFFGQVKAPHQQTRDNAISLTDTQSLEAKIQNQLVLDEQAAQVDAEVSGDIRSKLSHNEDVVMRDGQPLHHKAELETRKSKIDALLEKLSKQLQDLKHKEQEIQQEIKKGKDSKRVILDELHTWALTQQGSRNVNRRRKLSKGNRRSSVGFEGVGKYLKYLDRNLPKEIGRKRGSGEKHVTHRLIDHSPRSPSRDATNDVAHDRSAYNASSSEHSLRPLNKPTGFDGPADLSLSQSRSGELQGSKTNGLLSGEKSAQDAMNISESEENETKSIGRRTISSNSKILTGALVDSDEDYEPPSASNVPSRDPMTSFQSQKQLQEDKPLLAASNARPVTVSSSSNGEQRTSEVLGEIEHEQQEPLTHHSDSDDYEPPETVISTNSQPLTHHGVEKTIDVPSEPTDAKVAEMAPSMLSAPIPVVNLPPADPPSALNISLKAGSPLQ